MNKRKARNILIKSKNDLKYMWTMPEVSGLYLKTYIYVEHIFGKDSHEHTLYASLAPEDGMHFQKYHEGYNKIVDALIEIIDTKGISKPGNFLSRMNDTWLTTLLFAVAGGIFSAGYWAGQRDLISFKSSTNIAQQNTTPDQNKIIEKSHNNKQ